jgi:DNA-binding NarL/FixJ family response regulator
MSACLIFDSMRRITALLFEDNALMRESFESIMAASGQIDIMASYENAENIVPLYEAWQPDVLIMDIDMPVVNGLEGLQQLKCKYPDAKVLMLTVFEDNDNVLNAICNGANGYVLKSSPPEKIKEAVIEIMQGGAPLTPIVAQKILKHFPKPGLFSRTSPEVNLSEKEKQVLGLLVKGYSYKMIATELDKSVETIRVQIKSIYRKLQVQSNAEAIVKVLEQKIL